MIAALSASEPSWGVEDGEVVLLRRTVATALLQRPSEDVVVVQRRQEPVTVLQRTRPASALYSETYTVLTDETGDLLYA